MSENTFELGVFADFVDEMTEPSRTRIVTKREMNELVRHIGSFDNWPKLCDDAKIHVSEYLDYKSRCMLERCSKSDYEIVKKAPCDVHKVTIYDRENWDNELDDINTVTVCVQLKNGQTEIDLNFVQSGPNTEIRWWNYSYRTHKLLKSVTWDNCDYYETAVKFAEMWMKKSGFKMAAIHVDMAKYPFATSLIASLPNCTDVSIGAGDDTEARWWLEKLPNNLKYLRLYTSKDGTNCVVTADLFALPQITDAREVSVSAGDEFGDEQLLRMRSARIHVGGRSRVTATGINAFLRQWQRADGSDGFRELDLVLNRRSKHKTVLNGLGAWKWNAAFEREQASFVAELKRCFMGSGTTCYQVPHLINQYRSLTVSLATECLSIYATGQEWKTIDGESYTAYFNP